MNCRKALNIETKSQLKRSFRQVWNTKWHVEEAAAPLYSPAHVIMVVAQTIMDHVTEYLSGAWLVNKQLTHKKRKIDVKEQNNV